MSIAPHVRRTLVLALCTGLTGCSLLFGKSSDDDDDDDDDEVEDTGVDTGGGDDGGGDEGGGDEGGGDEGGGDEGGGDDGTEPVRCADADVALTDLGRIVVDGEIADPDPTKVGSRWAKGTTSGYDGPSDYPSGCDDARYYADAVRWDTVTICNATADSAYLAVSGEVVDNPDPYNGSRRCEFLVGEYTASQLSSDFTYNRSTWYTPDGEREYELGDLTLLPDSTVTAFCYVTVLEWWEFEHCSGDLSASGWSNVDTTDETAQWRAQASFELDIELAR